MSDILDKHIVIKLNKHWQSVAVMSVRASVVFLASEKDGEKPGFALDFETAVDETTGEHVLIYSQPVAWDDWVNLPVRPQDLAINTARGAIRVPLIVICARYAKVPIRSMRWSTGNVRVRDKGICQVSGRQLSNSEGNVGHIRARAHGGKDTFENTVWMDRKLNTLQGTKTPEEMGWKLIKAPKAPMARPVVIRKADAPMPEQTPFLLD